MKRNNMNQFIVHQTEKTEYPKANAGEYVSICYKIVDLGTQKNSYGNWQRKGRICWELHGDNMTSEGSGYMEDGKPFSVEREFNVSLGTVEKPTDFRKFLEAWRGRAFTEEELQGFDITKLLGAPCRLTVTHDTSKDGTKTYVNAHDAKPMIKGMPVPVQVNKSSLYLVSPWNQQAFEALPSFIRDKIKASREYQEMFGPKPEQYATDEDYSRADEEQRFVEETVNA